MSETVKINQDQCLYVIPSGKGYTCLGFDVAQKKTEAVAKWCGRADLMPVPEEWGTLEGWERYEKAMAAGGEYNRATGLQCPAALIPRFIGREGERVEVEDKEEGKRRFYIGKSTGWFPIHLEIQRRDSTGGFAAFVPEGASVRFLGSKR